VTAGDTMDKKKKKLKQNKIAPKSNNKFLFVAGAAMVIGVAAYFFIKRNKNK
jgi:LPXTG-motif cell wall-anchored protein